MDAEIEAQGRAVEAHSEPSVREPGKGSKAVAAACLAHLDAGLLDQARALLESWLGD